MELIFGFQILSFLGAFLLFYLELLMSKTILPVLGGAYFVWVTCVSFFTLVMLLSNWSFKISFEKFGDKITYLIFISLAVVSLFSFPILIPQESSGNDILFIFLTLTKNIGLPFFILSATSPVIQKFSFNLYPKKNPYTLYSLSNMGSLLALLLFPLFFEPFFVNKIKYLIAYVLYGLFIVIFGCILIGSYRKIQPGQIVKNGKLKLSWIFLSSSTTAFFLATTNFISYDIGSAPLFWAIPLGIFLLSFILNFKENPWRPKFSLYILIIVTLVLEFFLGGFLIQIFLQYLILFTACFEINKILYQSRPKEEFLPSFYLSISLGGLIGSLGILFAGPFLFKYNKFLSADFLLVLLLIIIGLFFHLKKFKVKRFLAAGSTFLIIIIYMFGFIKKDDEYYLRNFYGFYKIKSENNIKSLVNGSTIHGSQDLTNPSAPLAYYHPDSPIGEILNSREFLNIASVGLGVGNLLAYGKFFQTWDIVEIDPDVINIAKNHFSFIKNCTAKLNFLVGDGRIILSKQEDLKYDLIIMDAFSGDNIPFHLISIEAVRMYLNKLKDGGIIAFHISNRYHDFAPILKSTAATLGMKYFRKKTKVKPFENGIGNSDWFFIFKDPSTMTHKIDIKPWTDSYYNFWDTLKLLE